MDRRLSEVILHVFCASFSTSIQFSLLMFSLSLSLSPMATALFLSSGKELDDNVMHDFYRNNKIMTETQNG